MPRWLRVLRGMIGTGLTFAVGVGVVSLVLGLIALAFGAIVPDDLRMAGKLSVVAFIVGLGFSGVLAIAAQGKTFEKLSLRAITALGMAGGFLYFLFIGFMNGFRVWSLGTGLFNLAILTVLGGGAAAATLLVARRAVSALKPGEEPSQLGAGDVEESLSEHLHPRMKEPRR